MPNNKRKPPPSAKGDGRSQFAKRNNSDSNGNRGAVPAPLIDDVAPSAATEPPIGLVQVVEDDANETAVSSLTVLWCLGDRASASKRFTLIENGKLIADNVNPGKYFTAQVLEGIKNLAQLALLIDEISKDPRAFIVRSKPVETANTGRMLRRLHSQPDEIATLAEPPGGYCWCMVDFDSVEVADIDPVVEPERAIRNAIQKYLPTIFHDAGFYWQLSAQAGIKPGLRAHVFFWMSRPITCAELKVLFRGCPVDFAVFGPVQPYFVATPQFPRGVISPVPRRSGLYRDSPNVLLPPEPLVAAKQQRVKPNRGVGRGGGVARYIDFAPGFENKLAQLGDGIGLAGFHQPLISAAAAYVYQHGAAALARTTLKALLRAAIVSAPKRQGREPDIIRYTSDEYLNNIIASAIEKFAAGVVEPTYPAPSFSRDAARDEIARGVGCHLEQVARRESELRAWEAARDACTILAIERFNWLEAKQAKLKAEGHTLLFPPNREMSNTECEIIFSKFAQIENEHVDAIACVQAFSPEAAAALTTARIVLDQGRLVTERLPMPPPVTAIASDVGVGKTSEWMARVAQICGAVMAGPRHDLGDEIAAKLAQNDIDMAVYRGLSAEDPDAPGKKMCLDLSRAEAVLQAGLKLSEKACGSQKSDTQCPFYSICGYQRQRLKKPDVWYVPHNLLIHEKPTFIPTVSSLTIDETFYHVGLRGLEPKLEDCPSLAISDIALESGGTSSSGRLRAALEAASEGYIHADAFVASGITQTFCDFTIRYLWRDKDSAAGLKPGASSAVAEQRLACAVANNTSVHSQVEFWRLAARTVVHGGVSPWLRKIGARIYMQWRREIHPSWLAGAVLVLDATMPVQATREYLPRLGEVETIRVQMPFVHVRQVTDTAMSMTALIPNARAGRKKNRERAANVERLSRYIAVRSAGRRKVVVITYKDIEKKLLVPSNVEVAHFGAITGIDAWGDVDLLIVIGRMEPPPETVENLARTVHARHVERAAADAEGKVRYPRVRHGIRLRGEPGSASVRNSAHPDPDVEELRWTICEGGLQQAIGRARGVNRTSSTPLQVDILTNVALPVVVDEAVQWTAIQPTRIEVAAAQATAKALPLSDTELARCFPGLWPSAKAVAMERGRASGPSREDLVRAVWGDVALLRVTYRRTAGRGGQLSRAVIAASEPDARAALEAIVGRVSEFAIA